MYKKLLVMIPILVLGFPFLHMYVQGQSSFLTLENPTYGIEMQYPSSWNKDLNVSPPDVVTYFPSAVDSSASLTVTVDDISDEKGISLAQYASTSNDAIKHETTDFKLLESTTNNTLAGLPAYKSIYSYAARNNSTVQGMEIGAIKGNKVYIFTYEAGPNEYDQYLPIAQQIIYSFQFQIPAQSNSTVPSPAFNATTVQPQSYWTLTIYLHAKFGWDSVIVGAYGPFGGHQVYSFSTGVGTYATLHLPSTDFPAGYQYKITIQGPGVTDILSASTFVATSTGQDQTFTYVYNPNGPDSLYTGQQ